MQVTGLKVVPQDQEVSKSKQEIEERVILSEKEAENVKEETKNKEEEETNLARLPGDWKRGSVRRVTRQLEQRMKQEHDSPAPSTSPPSFSSSSSCPQRRSPQPHSSEDLHTACDLLPATTSDPQDASLCSQGSVVSTVQEEQEDGKLCSAETDKPQADGDRSTKTHKLQPADTRPLSTSLSSHPFVHSPHATLASVNFLCLEGVTELESATDWDCSTESPLSDIVMRETWETLCELGAFLQQVSSGRAGKARRVDHRVFNLSAGSAQKRGDRVQKRVREVEAKIRQAGLTPPSLMKRSASLAKLGCLELLANELSEWELSRTSDPPTSAEPAAHAANDESKKQRVHNSPPSANQQPEVLGISEERLSAAGGPSSGVSPPSNESQPRGFLPNSGQDSLQSPGLVSMTTRQQYGRTHPLRRLKKRTVSTLYHTM